MSSKSQLTLGERIKYIDEKIATLTANNHLPQEKIADAQTKTLTNISNLMQERQSLMQLASTVDQQQRYDGGVEQWNMDFVKIRTLESDTPSTHAAKNNDDTMHQNTIWNKLPSSRVKRVQELFTRDEDLIIPASAKATAGARFQFNKYEVQHMSIKGCLFDVERIPDELFEGLKLCDFSDVRGKPLLKIARKKEQIDRLKLILESAKEMQTGHLRILIISAPSPDVQARYPHVHGPDPSIIGTILYSREQANGHKNGANNTKKTRAPTPPRKLVMQHFSSAFAFSRKPHHQDTAYNREVSELINLQAKIAVLNEEMNELWKDEHERPALRERAASLAAEATHMLDNCTNEQKVEANALLQVCSTLKDKNGKENVTASMAQMIAAMNRLMQRLNTMHPIAGFNHQDLLAVNIELEKHNGELTRYFTKVLQAAQLIEKNAIALFNGAQAMSPAQMQSNTNGLRRVMGLDTTRLQQLSLQPFMTYADALVTAESQLSQKLSNRNKSEAIDCLITMHLIGKLYAVRHCFERMKECTANAQTIPLTTIRQFVAELETVFTVRQIFPERTLESYDALFAQLAQTLGKMRSRLDHYIQRNIDIHEQEEIYARLKQYVNGFDIESMVREMMNRLVKQ